MAEIIGFPGKNLDTMPGKPRHDIANMLRDIADRAERGEIEALVMTYSIVDGGVGFATCTPEECPYTMIGALDRLRDMVKERVRAIQPVADYENDPKDA